jgi:hypothetical protein
VIGDDQDRQAAHLFRSAKFRFRIARSVGLARQLDGKVKSASPAGLAFDPDLTVHHFYEVRADRQSQARAAVTPGRGGVNLSEGIENPLLIFGRDADPGVSDGELEKRGAFTYALGTRSPTNLRSVPGRG